MDRKEDSLLRAYARGNKRAFITLYEQYKQPVYHYLRKSCGGQHQADELFQEVWLRVISNAQGFDSRGRFRPWLFSIAHNCIVDFYRKEGRATLESIGDDNFPAESIDPTASSDQHRIEQAIARLPFDQRQAFYLREVCGSSIKEIAIVQDITIEAAKSRLRYAYAKLREMLKEDVQ